MSTEMILHANSSIKSPALKAAQDKLLKLAAAAETSRRGICMELAKIESGKLYEEDGFKSLAEYGETIGLDKSLTYKLENAGRLYLSDKPATKALAASLDWSKAAMLASEDASKVEAAAAAGELKPGMSANDVREWKAAQNVKKGGKEKVVPKWDIELEAFKLQWGTKEDGERISFGEHVKECHTVGIANPADWAREYDNTALVSSVKDSDGNTIYMAITADGSMFNYTAEKVKPIKKGKTPGKLTREQLLREIERYKKLLADEDADEEQGE